MNYLSKEGVSYLWDKIKNYVSNFVSNGFNTDWIMANTITTVSELNVDTQDLNINGVNIIDLFYPVGHILTTVSATYNPNNTFASTTWVRYGEGQVLVGFDSTDTDFDAVNKSGGAKTHSLTVAEMPAHTHTVSGTAASAGSHNHNRTLRGIANRIAGNTWNGVVASASTRDVAWSGFSSSTGAHTHRVSGTAASQGNGTAFSTMPPYTVVYYWRRTA